LESKQQKLNRWASEVSKYIDLWHKTEMGTGTNDTPMNRKERGDWRPPVAEKAHGIWDANRQAGSLIGPELNDLERRPYTGHGGFPFSDLLREMRQNPSARRNWKQAADLYPDSKDARKAEAVWNLCTLVAGVLIEAKPENPDGTPYELEVYMDPKDAEADSPKQAAARDREAGRRVAHEEAKLTRAKQIREIQRKENCTEAAAIGLWQDRTGMSYWTAKRSLRFADGISTEERPEPGVWRDFGDNGGEAA
jgi:hypothetical protein